MNTNINFGSPICRGENNNSSGLMAVEIFDDYFNLSTKKYKIIKNIEGNVYKVKSQETEQNVALNVLKVISYTTLVVPLIMLIGKIIARAQYSFVEESEHRIKKHKIVLNTGTGESSPEKTDNFQTIFGKNAVAVDEEENSRDVLNTGTSDKKIVMELDKVDSKTVTTQKEDQQTVEWTFKWNDQSVIYKETDLPKVDYFKGFSKFLEGQKLTVDMSKGMSKEVFTLIVDSYSGKEITFVKQTSGQVDIDIFEVIEKEVDYLVHEWPKDKKEALSNLIKINLLLQLDCDSLKDIVKTELKKGENENINEDDLIDCCKRKHGLARDAAEILLCVSGYSEQEKEVAIDELLTIRQQKFSCELNVFLLEENNSSDKKKSLKTKIENLETTIENLTNIEYGIINTTIDIKKVEEHSALKDIPCFSKVRKNEELREEIISDAQAVTDYYPAIYRKDMMDAFAKIIFHYGLMKEHFKYLEHLNLDTPAALERKIRDCMGKKEKDLPKSLNLPTKSDTKIEDVMIKTILCFKSVALSRWDMVASLVKLKKHYDLQLGWLEENKEYVIINPNKKQTKLVYTLVNDTTFDLETEIREDLGLKDGSQPSRMIKKKDQSPTEGEKTLNFSKWYGTNIVTVNKKGNNARG